jgi:hypothetical protein
VRVNRGSSRPTYVVTNAVSSWLRGRNTYVPRQDHLTTDR